MNEVTRYNNQLNTVPMRKWTIEEQNFFFSIITKARDHGTKPLTFEKNELIELASYSLEHNKRFYETMESLGEKIFAMRYKERTSNSLKMMALFQRFELHWSDDLSEMTAEIRISEDFDYIINRLDAEFTHFELKQFTNIRSSYAKEMFKKLKQWRVVGKKEYSIDEFRNMLQIPKSYRATDINQVVLKPIKEELSSYFSNLKIKKVKANTRGTPVTGYIFTWKPEKTGKWDPNKYESKQLGRKVIRKETMPDWYYEDSSEEDIVDPDVEKEFNEKLRKMREDKK